MKMTLTEWLASVMRLRLLRRRWLNIASSMLLYPALCVPRVAEVEPDGHCPHGAPSLLLTLGLVLTRSSIGRGKFAAARRRLAIRNLRFARRSELRVWSEWC